MRFSEEGLSSDSSKYSYLALAGNVAEIEGGVPLIIRYVLVLKSCAIRQAGYSACLQHACLTTIYISEVLVV